MLPDASTFQVGLLYYVYPFGADWMPPILCRAKGWNSSAKFLYLFESVDDKSQITALRAKLAPPLVQLALSGDTDVS